MFFWLQMVEITSYIISGGKKSKGRDRKYKTNLKEPNLKGRNINET